MAWEVASLYRYPKNYVMKNFVPSYQSTELTLACPKTLAPNSLSSLSLAFTFQTGFSSPTPLRFHLFQSLVSLVP